MLLEEGVCYDQCVLLAKLSAFALLHFVLQGQIYLLFNRMGKTRDLFKKIRGTKGTFHAKMGTVKDRNGMDLTEAKDIKKRWQEYTEELYKKSQWYDHSPRANVKSSGP